MATKLQLWRSKIRYVITNYSIEIFYIEIEKSSISNLGNFGLA